MRHFASHLLVVLCLLMAGNSLLAQDKKEEIRQSASIPIRGLNKIHVSGLDGINVTVRTWEFDSLAFDWVIRADKKWIDKYAKHSKLEYEERDGSGFLNVVSSSEMRSIDKESNWIKNLLTKGKNGFVSVSVSHSQAQNLELVIPKTMALLLSGKYGSINVESLSADLEIVSRSGSIDLSSIEGHISIDNDFGETNIRKTHGEMDVSTRSSKVNVEDHRGTVSIDGNFVNAKLLRISENVNVSSRSGSVLLEEIGGKATISGDFMDVKAEDVGTISVSSRSADIVLTNVGVYSLTGDFLDIEVDGSDTGQAILTDTRNGDIRIKRSSFPSGTFMGSRAEIELDRGSGDLAFSGQDQEIKLRNWKGSLRTRQAVDEFQGWNVSADSVHIQARDDISLEMANLPQWIFLESERGDVSLTLPKGFNGSISLEAESILRSRLSEYNTLELSEQGRLQIVEGKMGESGYRIVIRAKNGSIRLE